MNPVYNEEIKSYDLHTIHKEKLWRIIKFANESFSARKLDTKRIKKFDDPLYFFL